MMNIPLLYWAGQITGDPRFQQIAVNHADTVASYLVREDGSCGHIACINPDTGELEHILGGQGYSETSSWSRGQSWILYGFALSYRHTKNKKYLDIAKKTAHYFISNIALTGYIPLCDFRQPASAAYTDTSAGLCAACGLLEIAEHVDECEKNLTAPMQNSSSNIPLKPAVTGIPIQMGLYRTVRWHFTMTAGNRRI